MKELTKEQLYRYVGHPDQLYSVRRMLLAEGGGKGSTVLQVSTAGGLQVDLLPDSGLDIGQLRYQGIPISYSSKNGYDSPARYLPYEREFLHTFPAGMLYTCGLRNVGPGNREEGEWQPQHGRYHSISATEVSAYEEDGQIIVQGVLRETALFGPCLVLQRTIRIPVYGSEITVHDRLENMTPNPEEYMLLYHYNFGYPLLSEEAVLHLPKERVTTPRDDFSATGLDTFCQFTPPVDGEQERVFFHEMSESVATLENQALGIGVRLRWSGETLPVLAQWRCMASGEYVLGLEPSNNYIMGRAAERENGTLQILQPFAAVEFTTVLTFYSIS